MFALEWFQLIQSLTEEENEQSFIGQDFKSSSEKSNSYILY
jgi:hypothetical protein